MLKFGKLKVFSKAITLIVILGGILLVSDLSNRSLPDTKTTGSSEHKKLKLALLMYNDAPISEQSMEGIIDGLQQTGMIQGVDYELKISNAQGDIATLNNIINEAANTNYDLIFITSTPTLQTAIKKITDIPIVFTTVADPILAGAGKSFEDHLPNITGISTLGDYEGGMKNFLSIIPGIKSVGTLYTPSESNSVSNYETLSKIALDMGIEVIGVPVNNSADVSDAALALTSKRIDAVCQIIDNLTAGSFAGLIKAGNKNNIPVFGFVSSQANDGALAVVARDYHQGGLDAVNKALLIIRGSSPAKIPITYISKSELIINKSTAKKLGITIPHMVNSKAKFVE